MYINITAYIPCFSNTYYTSLDIARFNWFIYGDMLITLVSLFFDYIMLLLI
jgi:hypothetical protein